MKKIDFNRIEKKLDSILNTREFDRLQDITIFQEPDGSYKLFNKYSLHKRGTGDVMVSLINGDDINSFFSIKNALCWCVFDKLGKYRLADRVIELDMSLSSVDVHISVHTKLFKKAKKTEDKLIYLAKLNEDKLQKKSMSQELEDYIENSYIWQQKRFGLKSEH